MLKIPETRDRIREPLERLPASLREKVREKGIVREYDPGDLIVAPSDPGEIIRFFLSGKASVVLRDDENREVAVDTVLPGDMYGEISFLTGRPAPSNTELVADDHCSVLEVTGKDFREFLKDEPDFTVTLAKNLARKITRLDRSIFESKLKRRALQSLISSEDHIFPDYVIGDYVRRHVAKPMHELAFTDGPVLVIGETGVGKEVLAHAVFKMSHQHKEVFLLLDMARIRSERRGWEAEDRGKDGVFDEVGDQMRLFFGDPGDGPRGDQHQSSGYLELCEGGTLLVRGVEHLATPVQQKLLDAIKTGQYIKTGQTVKRHLRTRLVITTELDATEISPDVHPLIHGLLDRSITVPPLRKRRREIPALVSHYLEKYSRDFRKPTPEPAKLALKMLVNYSWPGNDVELSATIKRAMLVCEDTVLKPEDIYLDVKRVEGEGKLDLFRFRPVRHAVLSPLFPAVLQSAATPFFVILLFLLMLGPVDPMTNPASLFSWAVGWPALVFGSFFWARFWCSICPMGVLGKLAKKLINLDKPFPSGLKYRSDFVIAGTVLLIIWLESVTHMRQTPWNLGILLIVITALAVSVSVIFERQSWCRYLCPLGGMTGVLAQGAIVELRADNKVCASQCKGHECYFGTENREGCPFGQVAPTLRSNQECKLCSTCVKNCPHGAISLNLRVPGHELFHMRQVNAGTAFLVISMVGALLSELVVRSQVAVEFGQSHELPYWALFTMAFLGLVLLFNAGLLLAAAISSRLGDETIQENYSHFGLALLPLAMTSFMAFHMYYLINLGVHLPMLVAKTFNLAVFQQLIITVPPDLTYFIQKILIGGGLLWSGLVGYRLARSSHENFVSAVATFLPHCLLACFLAFSLAQSLAFMGLD